MCRGDGHLIRLAKERQYSQDQGRIVESIMVKGQQEEKA